MVGVLEASHFRGGALVPEITASGNLTFRVTTFWAKGVTDSIFPTVTGSVSGFVPVSTSPPEIDTSDSRFDAVSQVVSSIDPVSGAQTFTIEWESCCRIAGIRNADEDSWYLSSMLVWDGRSTTKPIDFNFASIQPEVVRGVDYGGNLSAVSPVGHTLSYDQALALSITSQPPGFAVDPSTGDMHIPAASTAGYQENFFGEPGGDYAFSGNIFATSGGVQTGRVQFDWMFDAVNTGGANNAPVVADATINANVGDTVTHTFTATDPDGDVLTWSFVGQLGADPPIAPVFDAQTRQYRWVTSGAAPGVYTAQARASDGTRTDTGSLTINLREAQFSSTRVCDIRGEWNLNGHLGGHAPALPLMPVGFTETFNQEVSVNGGSDIALVVPGSGGQGQSIAVNLPHRTGPNGGSTSRTNAWTIVMDVRFTDVELFEESNKSLLETSVPTPDGLDLFVSGDGTIFFGPGNPASPVGAIEPGVWYRIGLTCRPSFGPGSPLDCFVFVNGIQVGQATNPFDGNVSLDPQSALLFGNGGGGGELELNNLGFWGRALPPMAMEALGAARAGSLLPEVLVTTSDSSGEGSLREAIDGAVGPTRVVIDPAIQGGVMVLEEGDEFIVEDKDLVISNVATEGGVAITGAEGAETRVMTVGAGSCVQLVNFSVFETSTGCQLGDIRDIGGAILNLGDLLVINSSFESNEACFGGAIFNMGRMELRGNTFSGNFALISGGAIYNFDGAQMAAEDSHFSGNSAGFGGGVYNDDAVASFLRCGFSENFAVECGGALENYNVLRVVECDFESNSAGVFGGGITSRFPNGTSNNVGQPVITVLRSSFVGNSASQGGGIFINSSLNGPSNLIQNCTIDLNSASSSSGDSSSSMGGGIACFSGDTRIVFCTITRNHAPPGRGAGLSAPATVSPSGVAVARTEVTNSIVTENPPDSATAASDVDVTPGGSPNPFVTGGGNLIGFGSGAGAFVGPNDQTGITDAALGGLDSRNARTPQLGSPALENGVLFTLGFPDTDQVGAPRLIGLSPDSGAVEAETVDINVLGIVSFAPAGTDPGTGEPLFRVTWTSVPGATYQIECSQSLDFGSPLIVGPMAAEGTSITYTLPLREGADFLRVRMVSSQ
ncbi:hypothetical protein BH23VER1_BH23VER1_31060 [soil metagenome]